MRTTDYTNNRRNSEERFRSAVYGTAALALVSVLCTMDALDQVEERRQDWIKGVARRWWLDIVGREGRMGAAEQVRCNLNALVPHSDCQAWMQDFGNAVMKELERPLFLLHHTLANHLGRYPGIEERNAMADLIIAQSMASETMLYARREQERQRGNVVSMASYGRRLPVAFVVGSLSNGRLYKALTELCRLWVGARLPDGVNVLADDDVRHAANLVIATLETQGLWERAVRSADKKYEEANPGKVHEYLQAVRTLPSTPPQPSPCGEGDRKNARAIQKTDEKEDATCRTH